MSNTTRTTAVPHSPVVSERDAARYCGASLHTVRRWRTRGVGPDFLRLGVLIRYRLSDLDRWLDGHTVRGAQ